MSSFRHDLESCPAGRRSKVSLLTATFWFAATVTLLSIVTMEFCSVSRRTTLFLLLPAVQAVGAFLTAWLCRRPESRRQWGVILFVHAILASFPIVIAGGHYEWCRLYAVQSGTRLLLITLWLLSLSGLLLLALTIQRGRLRWRPWVPRLLRIGMGAAFVLVGLETTATVLERQQRPPELTPGVLPTAKDDVIRIAALGGSTMLGFPYAPEWGIAQVAVCELQHRYPDRTFELQNLAETGVNLAQAIAKTHTLTVRPDVLIVYSGHNQFFHNMEELMMARRTEWKVDAVLRKSAIFRLIQPLLAQQAVSAPVLVKRETLCGSRNCPELLEQTRLQRYGQQLSSLLAWAQAGGTSVVFCVPAADEATFAPSRSWCRTQNPEVRRQIEQTWQQVRQLQQQQQWQAALDLCESILRDEPQFAEFLFLAGRSCRHLGDAHTPDAHRYFEAAIEWDQFPIRARQSYRDVGRRVAQDANAVVVDCPSLLRDDSPDGFLDDRYFLDGVHPNLRACYLLGQAVADAISHETAFDDTPPIVPALTFEDCLHVRRIDDKVLVRAYQTTAKVLEHYAAFRNADDNDRQQAADRFAENAKRLTSGTLPPEDWQYGGLEIHPRQARHASE